MKKRGEKDAVISGICFILYAVILLLMALISIVQYFITVNSVHFDKAIDSISGWAVIFSLIGVIAGALALFILLFIAIIAGILGAVYLTTGILVLRKKPGPGLAIVSFVLSGCYLFLWILFLSSSVGTEAVNPVSIAGTIFFASFSLILGVPKFSSGKWFIRKYWWLPFLLLAASVLFAPLKNALLILSGGAPDSSYIVAVVIGLLRLILLFPAYYFGCRWMKEKAASAQKTWAGIEIEHHDDPFTFS